LWCLAAESELVHPPVKAGETGWTGSWNCWAHWLATPESLGAEVLPVLLLQIKPQSLLLLLHRAGKMARTFKKKKKKGYFWALFVSKGENSLGRCWHSQNLKGGIW